MRTDVPPAALFEFLWGSLADILGTAATAAILRRAARRAAERSPDLADLTIAKDGLEYRFTVPRSWQEPVQEVPAGLHELVRELRPLLVELTGAIVVRRLEQIPELRQRGIFSPNEEPR
jgi:hypothetical protein